MPRCSRSAWPPPPPTGAGNERLTKIDYSYKTGKPVANIESFLQIPHQSDPALDAQQPLIALTENERGRRSLR